MTVKRADNYRYWQTQSHHWKDEIERRRRTLPVYHLQELFLSEYLGRCGPIRVLEFGCGYGRHLEYLNQMDGIEVHGYEQSSVMLDQLDWADPEWLSERVTLGEPLARLPYDDDSFDVVLTVSVLIHMPPEDARTIAKELARVSRWQILNVENNSSEKPGLTSTMHGGCWSHDFGALYEGLARETAILPKRFMVEDIYRSVLDTQRELPQVDEISSAFSLALDSLMTHQFNDFEARSIRENKILVAKESQLAAREQQREESRKMAEHQSSLRQEMAERARRAESKIEPLRLRARRAEGQLAAIRHRKPELNEILARLEELEEALVSATGAVVRSEAIDQSLLDRISELESDLRKTRSSLSDFISSLNQPIMN